MYPYRNAIDQTTDTLQRRTKHFRNLIVAVTFLGLCSVLGAGIYGSWLPLAGVFLLVPFCGLYLFIDGKLLNQWRHDLFAGWEKGEIDFQAFHDAVISISTLPKDSVKSLLATLPAAGDLVAEQGISPSTRKAIAFVVATIHACRSDEIALKAAGYTITGGIVIAAMAYWQWQPLLGVVAVGLIILLQKRIKTHRLNGAGRRIRQAQQEPAFSWEQFMTTVSRIHWTPISAPSRETFLAALSGKLHDANEGTKTSVFAEYLWQGNNRTKIQAEETDRWLKARFPNP